MAKQPVDYEAQLAGIADQFKMVRILDEEGNVVNPDIMPDLTDDQLVELMREWSSLELFTNVLWLILVKVV